MGRVGAGYGSEWQLTRFLGRHRAQWDMNLVRCLGCTGGDLTPAVAWEEFPYSKRSVTHDTEIKGMDFLPPEKRVEWQKAFWPDRRAPDVERGGIQTWDAVGRLRPQPADRGGRTGEWVLVEAKAHEAELTASPACGAGGRNRETIRQPMEQTYLAMGGDTTRWPQVAEAWLAKGRYQIANRLAALQYLRSIGEPGHVLFVYFLNDRYPGRSPASVDPWRAHLERIYRDMGILFSHHSSPSFIPSAWMPRPATG